MFREKSSSETHINCQKSCPICERNIMPSEVRRKKQSKLTELRLKKKKSIEKLKKKPKRKTILLKIKAKHAPKKTLRVIRSCHFEKPKEDSWITSGTMGNRDCVLVFRTNILSEKDIEAEEIVNSNNNSNSNSSSSSLNSDSSKSKSDRGSTNVNPLLPINLNRKTKGRNTHSSVVVYSTSKKETIKITKRLHKSSISCSDSSISSDGFDHPNDPDPDPEQDQEYSLNTNDSFRNKDNDCEQVDGVNIRTLPASTLKICYKFINAETRLLKRIFQRHGLSEVTGEENFSILWTGAHMKADVLRNLTPYQRVNHFPRSYELTRKDRLYKNIEKMQYLRGFKHFDIVPQSFVLPLDYRELVTAHNKFRGPWIVKPTSSSRGRGIFIVNSPDQIPPDEQGLVSKYIADPLCIDGHKCDIRVYVAVMSFDPLIIYLYEEGLVRLATVKYDPHAENLWNPCMHLCNYSINKYHSDYIKSNDADDEDVGHKWTLSALLRHLKNQGCDTNQLMVNIEDLIIKSLFACCQSIVAACRMFVPSGNNCFELYGFDILIDDTLKPWLLEINLSPSMGIDTPLDTKVKASLITDLLTLAGIPAYSPVVRKHFDNNWTRYRNITTSRRTNSAEPVTSKKNKTTRGSNKTPVKLNIPLTSEELRIIRSINLQNFRRGGFVRIFPTEDTMQKYGTFLDPIIGIPFSTAPQQGHPLYSTVLPHNYNLMVFNELYSKNKENSFPQGNTVEERMQQYERAIETAAPINFGRKKIHRQCIEEGKRLRKVIRKLIENGSELTQLQSRQAFGSYLLKVLQRLTEEPRSYHEKLILKFINRCTGTFKTPLFYKNPISNRIISKDRSAMVAKLLSDYLDSYNKETESYVDTFETYGMIPIALFNEFLIHAQEQDLESVLSLQTNLTGTMPYLFNRCGSNVPSTPPIPVGQYGFLKALPSMVHNSNSTNSKIEYYYKTSKATVPNSITIETSAQKKSAKVSVANSIVVQPSTSNKILNIQEKKNRTGLPKS